MRSNFGGPPAYTGFTPAQLAEMPPGCIDLPQFPEEVGVAILKRRPTSYTSAISMKIFRKTPWPPELAAFPASEKKRVWQSCRREAISQGMNWPVFLAYVLCSSGGSVVGDWFHVGIWGAGLGSGVAGLLYSQLIKRSTLEIIRERYPLSAPGRPSNME